MPFVPLKQPSEEGNFAAQAPVFTDVPPRDSFLNRSKEALKERGTKFVDLFNKTKDGDVSPAETGIRTVGNVVGAVGDVFGAALEPAVRPAIEAIGGTELGGKGLTALSEGIESYEAWKAKNPTNERVGASIESLVNISDVFLGGAIGRQAGKKAAVAGSKAASKATRVTSNVVKDVIPTTDRIVNSNITKALDLTQGDVRNISQSTGNEVGEWVAKNNLIRGNRDETVQAIDELFKKQYQAVRDEISAVSTLYETQAVPRYEDALKKIISQTDEVVGLENDNAVARLLLKKDEITLTEVQEVKEMLDDHFSLYKATGDLKEGVAKKGLQNMREELRTFIEKEVKETTGSDIRVMNNDVSTAKGITNAADSRSTRGLTRSDISLADVGLFGAGTFASNPAVGFALLVANKSMNSPSFKLKAAKWFDKLSDAKKLQAVSEFKSGKVPKDFPSDLLEIVGGGAGIGVVDNVSPNQTPR